MAGREQTDTGAGMGTALHMAPIRIEDLPLHPDFEDLALGAAVDEQRPALQNFVLSILAEADAALESGSLKWSGEAKAKESAPSVAKVEAGKKLVTAAEMQAIPWADSILPSRRRQPLAGKEEWFGRRSEHANKAEAGTATFAELDDGLRKDHGSQEARYDPSIYDTHLVIDYVHQIAEANWDSSMTGIEVKVYEMAHLMPQPLRPRVFSVCIVAARLGNRKFIVAQLPIDLADYPAARYASGRNTREGTTAQEKKPTVPGRYVSIERGIELDETCRWEMITASDAGGRLPVAVQKLAILGAVAKDVGRFMAYNARKNPRRAAAQASESG